MIISKFNFLSNLHSVPKSLQDQLENENEQIPGVDNKKI